MLRLPANSVRISASRDVVFSVLTDYHSYDQWVPGINYSRLLEREGEVAIVELTSPQFATERFQLEFVASPKRALSCSQIDRFRSGLLGQWRILDDPQGQGVIVTGELRARGSFVRSLLSRVRLRRACARILHALVDRVAMVASGVAPESAVRRKILELVLGPDHLEAWILGETYELVKKAEGRRT